MVQWNVIGKNQTRTDDIDWKASLEGRLRGNWESMPLPKHMKRNSITVTTDIVSLDKCCRFSPNCSLMVGKVTGMVRWSNPVWPATMSVPMSFNNLRNICRIMIKRKYVSQSDYYLFASSFFWKGTNSILNPSVRFTFYSGLLGTSCVAFWQVFLRCLSDGLYVNLKVFGSTSILSKACCSRLVFRPTYSHSSFQ